MPLVGGGSGSARDVQVHPLGVLRKLPQQHRRRNAARLPPAGIFHIRHIRFDQLPVILQHRQFPEPFPAAVARLADAPGQRRRIAHHSGARLAQRYHHRPRQRGNVHQPGNAQAAGVAQRVGQYQPPFGVRVDDLNGLAVHRRDHIPRTLRLSSRHILRGGHQPGHIDARLQHPDGPHSGDYRRAAGHIALHRFHIGGRLQRNAAGVKGNALAHQPQVVGRMLRVAPVGQRDELGRLGAALRHAQQRPHPVRPHPVPVYDVKLQPCISGRFPRRFRHPGGRHYIRRMIDQIPGQHSGFRQRRPRGYPCGQGVQAGGVPFHNDDPVDCAAVVRIISNSAAGAGVALAAAIGVKSVQPQQRTLGNGLRRLAPVQPADARAVGDSGELGHALAPQEPAHIPADPPHGGRVKIIGLAQPGHHHALGRYAAHGMQQRHFARLALDFAIGNEAGNRPVQRAVHGAGSAGRLPDPLKKVDDQRRRGKSGDIAGNGSNGNGSHKQLS